mmetsp:Transcript_100475/g.259952  ORF Transcript_100475/g.259952 Transcript_100475/m.259952 type:complete len:212 (-) Transcript_100475:178-813(-)
MPVDRLRLHGVVADVRALRLTCQEGLHAQSVEDLNRAVQAPLAVVQVRRRAGDGSEHHPQTLWKKHAIRIKLDRPIVGLVLPRRRHCVPNSDEDVGVQSRAPPASIGARERSTDGHRHHLARDAAAPEHAAEAKADGDVAEDLVAVAGKRASTTPEERLRELQLIPRGHHQCKTIQRRPHLLLLHDGFFPTRGPAQRRAPRRQHRPGGRPR